MGKKFIYRQFNYVSDLTNAKFVDQYSVNAWQIAINKKANSFWVSNNNSGKITQYGLDGKGATSSPINVPNGLLGNNLGNPNGLIINNSDGFPVTLDTVTKPAQLIGVNEDAGFIFAYNENVDSQNAIIVSSPSEDNIYKGIAQARYKGKYYIYVANFRQARIEQYDENWNLVRFFTDPALVALNYGVFNVAVIDDLLYVTFGLHDPQNHDAVDGLGNGYVDVFQLNGTLLGTLISQGELNSPWGLQKVGSNLFVGNFGSGQIGVYGLRSGKFKGFVTDKSGAPIVIDGLWGLALTDNCDIITASGPGGESNGLVAILIPKDSRYRKYRYPRRHRRDHDDIRSESDEEKFVDGKQEK